MIVYCVVSNAILTQPMKIRSEIELVTSYTTIQQKLVNPSFKPQLYHLDNKPPKSLKTFMTKVDENFQLTPPHIYWVSAAERAM